MALTNKKQWSEQQRKAGERAFWNQDNEIWFGWNWVDQDHWINKAQGKLPDLTESIEGQVGNKKGEWNMSGFNLDSPLNFSSKQTGMTADPGVRIFDSYQELTDPEGKRAAGYKEQQELFDKMNPLYERYSGAYDKYQGSIADNDALYQQTKSEWDRQNKAGDAADWSTYENLNKRYEASSQALNMLGAETRNVWDAYSQLSDRYADTPEKFDELYGKEGGTVYTNPEGRFLKTEGDKFKNLDTGKIRTADSFQDLNALARKDESQRLAKRFSLAQQKKGVVRDTLETERANKGMTLAERLKQATSAVGNWQGLDRKGATIGEKLQPIKDLATEFHNRKYGLGMIPELVSGTAQAGDEYIKSLKQTAGLKNYTKENPMKITLDRDTRVRTANTVNEWLNKQSPERQEHFLSGGQPTTEELGRYEHGMAPDNSLNYALVSKEFERKGGGDAGRTSAYYNTIHNLAGGNRDTFTGVHRGPEGKLRVGGLSDNYQFTDDEDITALNPILKPLQRAAMSIGQATGAYKNQSNENIADYEFNQSLFSKKNQGGTGQTMRTPAHLDLSDVYRPSIADLAKQWGRKVFRIPN